MIDFKEIRERRGVYEYTHVENLNLLASLGKGDGWKIAKLRI